MTIDKTGVVLLVAVLLKSVDNGKIKMWIYLENVVELKTEIVAAKRKNITMDIPGCSGLHEPA